MRRIIVWCAAAAALFGSSLALAASPAGATPVPTSTVVTTSATTHATLSCVLVTSSVTATCTGHLGTAGIGALVSDGGHVILPGTTVTALAHPPHMTTVTMSHAATGAATETVLFTVNPVGRIPSGHPVRYTATVSRTGPGTAAGVMSWSIAGIGITAHCSNGGTFTPLNGHGVAICLIPAGVLLSSGSPFHVRAYYPGDVGDAPSTGTFTQGVTSSTSKTFLAGSPLTPTPGAGVTFTAAVVPGKYGTSPTGTVTFSFGLPTGAPLVTCSGGNTRPLTFSGATCSIAGLSTAGVYIVTAAYGGNVNTVASHTCPVATVIAHLCSGKTRSVKFKLR